MNTFVTPQMNGTNLHADVEKLLVNGAASRVAFPSTGGLMNRDWKYRSGSDLRATFGRVRAGMRIEPAHSRMLLVTDRVQDVSLFGGV